MSPFATCWKFRHVQYEGNRMGHARFYVTAECVTEHEPTMYRSCGGQCNRHGVGQCGRQCDGKCGCRR